MDIKKIVRESLIKESYGSKNLIVVDIQPEYGNHFSHWLSDFIEFINENHNNFNSITFLFNGPDLGFLDTNEYISWLVYDNGLDMDIVNNIKFVPKYYAFFRYLIDSGVDDEDIVDIISFMVDNEINDSREISEDMWDNYMHQYGNEEIRELLEGDEGDSINIPDVYEEIKDINNVLLCGGALNECLKEIILIFDSLNTPYELLNNYIYH